MRRGEKVTVDVPLNLTGDIIRGALLAQENTSVSVEAEATHLPNEIELSLDGLAIGTIVTAADLKLPEGTTLAGDPEQVLVIINEAPTAEQIEADIAEDASASSADSTAESSDAGSGE